MISIIRGLSCPDLIKSEALNPKLADIHLSDNFGFAVFATFDTPATITIDFAFDTCVLSIIGTVWKATEVTTRTLIDKFRRILPIIINQLYVTGYFLNDTFIINHLECSNKAFNSLDLYLMMKETIEHTDLCSFNMIVSQAIVLNSMIPLSGSFQNAANRRDMENTIFELSRRNNMCDIKLVPFVNEGTNGKTSLNFSKQFITLKTK